LFLDKSQCKFIFFKATDLFIFSKNYFRERINENKMFCSSIILLPKLREKKLLFIELNISFHIDEN